MNKRFIYTFDNQTKEKLLKKGYALLKAYPSRSIFVFANNEKLSFCFDNERCVMSDTLTF